MKGCSCLFGLCCMLVGLGSIWVLTQIGGKSDGPGALFFYIGAAGGLFFGFQALSFAARSGNEDE